MKILQKTFMLLAFMWMISSNATAQKKIYIANDDHTDYMWAGNEAQYKQAFLDMLDYYLNLTESTSSLAPEYQSKFNCDGTFWVKSYEQNRTAQQFQRLINQIADGHISVPFNTLICTYGGQPAEAVIRGMYYAGYLQRKYNIPITNALAMENQTLPYGLPSIWAGAGVKYAWHGVCACASTVPVTSPRTYEIYRWTGADDNSVLLKFYSFDGNSSLGGYAEARDISDAINLAAAKCNTTSYPYSIAGAFGYGWDDLESTTDQFVKLAQSNTNADKKIIVSNERDFFQDFESNVTSIPSMAESFGNDWDVLCASLAEVSAGVKRSLEKLRAAEAMATLVSLKSANFASDLSSLKDNAYNSFGLYWEHDWTADGPVSRNDRAQWERNLQQNIAVYTDSLYNRSSRLLGNSIINKGSNPRFYVFNPLGWKRTDVADFLYSGSQSVYITEVLSGNPVPMQFITKNGLQYIRILASDIPSIGYKTYELKTGNASSLPDAATVNGNTIENAYYKVTFTNQGVITSLIDKQNGNKEFAKSVNNKYINDLGSGTGSNGNLSITNKGSVSVSLSISSDSPIKHKSTLTLYKDVPRIDIENQIVQNFGNATTWSYSFNLTNPEVMHEEVGAICKAKLLSQGGSYANDHASYKWLTLNHFAAMNEGQSGITLSNADCYFMRLGNSEIGNFDVTTPQINVLAGGQVANGNTLGIINQGGDNLFTQRFALQPYASYSASKSMQMALEHQNPFVTNVVSGNDGYPETSFSLLTLDSTDVFLWALKPAEEGINNGMVLRLWNMNNNNISSTATLNGSILGAKNISHVEKELTDASFNNNKLSIDLIHNQIKSYKVQFVLNNGSCLPGKAGKPMGIDSLCENSISLTYTTSGASQANAYTWSIYPANAGKITGSGLSSGVDWNNTFYGKAYIKVIGNNACGTGANSDSLEITIYQKPIVSAGNDQNISFHTSTQLHGTVSGGSTDYDYSWTPSTLLASINVSNPYTVLLDSSTLFTLSVKDHQTLCTNQANVKIYIVGVPLAVKIKAQKDSICSGDSSLLYALPSGGTGDYTYTWSSVPPGLNSTLADVTVSPLFNTLYQLNVKDNSSYSTALKTITVLSKPPKPTIRLQNNILVSSAPLGNQWINSHGIISGETNTYFSPPASGTYYVSVVLDGCLTISDAYDYTFSSVPILDQSKTMLYPNPANGKMTVKFTDSTTKFSGIYLINTYGMTVRQYNVTVNPSDYTVIIDLYGLSPGIYLLKLQGDNVTEVHKIILQ
jgi:alpha-mannosidase